MPDTPATQPAAHPTRSAPLCKDCAYHVELVHRLNPDVVAGHACGHPSTPIDTLTGQAIVPVKDMRARYPDTRWADFSSAHCGPTASLFEPLPSSQQATVQVLA